MLEKERKSMMLEMEFIKSHTRLERKTSQWSQNGNESV